MDSIKELRRIRKERGLSYERMARELGVSWRTLYRWLNEKIEPSLMAQEKISAYIDNRAIEAALTAEAQKTKED